MHADTYKAIDLARAWGHKYLPWEDREEQVQDFTVWVLDHLEKYDPERGMLSTFVSNHFYYWQQDVRKRYRPGLVLEEWIDPALPVQPDHRLSGRAAELLSLVPEKGREIVQTHLAYGASLTATAELHNCTERTVSRWVARAREIWAEVA